MAAIMYDSRLASLDEALAGITIPADIRRTLVLFSVRYFSFDGKMHQGQLVAHNCLKNELRQLFAQLLAMKFPIARVVPVVAYGWSDDASMAANNSHAFNLRLITGTIRFSQHSYGWALDLNPMLNPCITGDGRSCPPGAFHDHHVPGTLYRGSDVVNLFLSYGWTWGGNWSTLRDYQHFEKPLKII